MKNIIFSLIVFASFSSFAKGGPENSIAGLEGNFTYRCSLKTDSGVEKLKLIDYSKPIIAQSSIEAKKLFLLTTKAEFGNNLPKYNITENSELEKIKLNHIYVRGAIYQQFEKLQLVPNRSALIMEQKDVDNLFWTRIVSIDCNVVK